MSDDNVHLNVSTPQSIIDLTRSKETQRRNFEARIYELQEQIKSLGAELQRAREDAAFFKSQAASLKGKMTRQKKTDDRQQLQCPPDSLPVELL